MMFNTTYDHCSQRALTNALGLTVQFALAFIAFGALIVKRYCEPQCSRRSWIVWFYDTSKQGFGAALIHFANVLLSSVFHGDPCTWYIVSFLLDSTIGLVIIYIGLRLSQKLVDKFALKHLTFGEYGYPPKLKSWIGQTLIYLVVMLIEKGFISVLLLFNFWTQVRKFILYPIKDPNLELIIVMFIVPFLVNTLIFWIVDNFLKRKIRGLGRGGSSGGIGHLTGKQRAPHMRYSRYANDDDDREIYDCDMGGEVGARGGGVNANGVQVIAMEGAIVAAEMSGEGTRSKTQDKPNVAEDGSRVEGGGTDNEVVGRGVMGEPSMTVVYGRDEKESGEEVEVGGVVSTSTNPRSLLAQSTTDQLHSISKPPGNKYANVCDDKSDVIGVEINAELGRSSLNSKNLTVDSLANRGAVLPVQEVNENIESNCKQWETFA